MVGHFGYPLNTVSYQCYPKSLARQHYLEPEELPINTFLRFCAAFACLLLTFSAARAQTPNTPALPFGVNPHYFDYDQAAPFPITEKPYGNENGVQITKVTFPSLVQTPYAVNNTVTAYLFTPPGPSPHPAMVVLHEFNPSSTASGFLLCRAIARAQVSALMVVEPFSLNRTPMPHSKDDARILSGNVPDMVRALSQMVFDARRGLDYLAKRPDVDPSRMGIAGISLGGIMSGVVAGVDPRVKVVLTLVGGADFPKDVWDGVLTSPLRRQILGSGYTYETYSAAMAPIDSSTWLPRKHFNPDDVLMINGYYDTVILPNQAKLLAQNFGGTHIVWLNSGHYGAQFSAGPASDLGVKFLRARFYGETAAFHRPDGLPSRTIKLGLLFGGHEGVSPTIATSLINFDGPGRYTVDSRLSLHGLSADLSARIGLLTSVGIEFPIFHGTTKPKPFVMFSLTL